MCAFFDCVPLATEIERPPCGPDVVIVGLAAARIVPRSPRRRAARRARQGAAASRAALPRPAPHPAIKREVCHTMPPLRAKDVPRAR
ncbi:hypothetical protein CI15_17840 [Paraburkholderia monticola]|uniref:Uncharacterized protein n=1 Tax=Paraburkholderia monticola TaxID=1399968 RepID=A0A149PN55_9BURK|nr:hypothetical protein CI15_17840 [Paraburkholderia monticola]